MKTALSSVQSVFTGPKDFDSFYAAPTPNASLHCVSVRVMIGEQIYRLQLDSDLPASAALCEAIRKYSKIHDGQYPDARGLVNMRTGAPIQLSANLGDEVAPGDILKATTVAHAEEASSIPQTRAVNNHAGNNTRQHISRTLGQLQGHARTLQEEWQPVIQTKVRDTTNSVQAAATTFNSRTKLTEKMTQLGKGLGAMQHNIQAQLQQQLPLQENRCGRDEN